jgi:hypothetical protein
VKELPQVRNRNDCSRATFMHRQAPLFQLIKGSDYS